MRIGKLRNSLFCLLLLIAPISVAQTAAPDDFVVHTGQWAPYVEAPAQAGGSAQRIVRLVLQDMGLDVRVQYTDYAYSYYRMRSGSAGAAFPFFRTASREREVAFSNPLFTVKNRIFYNRQHHDFAAGVSDYAGLRFGRVAGYSYGAQIDALLREPVEFASEVAAMKALLGGSIDLLPITEAVASALLLTSFPNEKELIRAVGDFQSDSTLHIIAARNAEGRAFIERFNASHARLLKEGVITNTDQSALTAFAGSNDVVEIIASEGFPIVLGVDNADASKHYAIPQGSRAIVIKWSDKILQPSATDRLYKTMVEESVVVIVSGPHVGKELRVKNMHLSIIE
ncbi:MAG: substrate-binding periplasmic protein [Gammaproteobacteria bacterium]